MALDYNNIATVVGAESFQEAAIILEGPPIEIFAQRAAPTVVFKPLRQTRGRFYYECKTATAGYMQLGWADEDFQAIAEQGKGCGDDAHSWAYDGKRCLKWHENKKEKYGEAWSAGDVIGIAIDIDQRQIMFSLNGKDYGKAFENISISGGIYPCMSLARGERVQIFLGNESDPFNHQPPASFLPLTIAFPPEVIKEDPYNKFSSIAKVINMGLSEHSFSVSFPGEMMVTMMRRGLDYEAKKNALIHGGYEATLKKWQQIKDTLGNIDNIGLTNDEIYVVICYTLEKPPVYRYFNGDSRKGYGGDGMDFPILTYLLREACRKILAATPKQERTKIVYRGVSVPFAAEVGQKVRFGSYTSTTANRQVADEFRKTSEGTQFVIVTKIGAPIKMFSAFPEEEEVLLPPYEIYRIHRIEESPSVIHLASVFEDDFVDRYVADGNAVYEANNMAKNA
ncbi:uncharacterized protein LOC116300481 [Actinia tenebrosa]|uniref:NAD(P)(+)--arginine ADP-ribosyltransferase n=1 Tax=Actinia tenebrosa TaxID=6105 RepID=A0A6P8IEF7_ACTTE|nr:uncharacterized protein LOC116300481 [Actinia tenebrosa]